MLNNLDASFRFQQDALRLRGYRQELLASNIANADTPGYKAKDIDFARELQRVQGAQVGRVGLAATAAMHMQPQQGSPLNASVMYRTPTQPSIDGNTVDSEVETAQFSDNAIRYQASLTFMSLQIKNMLSAIQG